MTLTWRNLKKEVAELKEKEVLAKESTVEEYKASDDFQDPIEQVASMEKLQN